MGSDLELGIGMAKQRINWLLIIQGWAMLWVVIGHAFLGKPNEGPMYETVLFKFAYSFHMPLFMLISGYLFWFTRLNSEEWKYGRIVWDKAIRLILPGLVFSILAFAVKIAFSSEMEREVGYSFHEVLHAYLYPYDNPMRELWFIVTLFWLMMLAPFWKASLQQVWTLLLTLVALTILYFSNLDIGVLCVGQVLRYGIWFYLGLVFSKTDIVEGLMRQYPGRTLLAGITLYVIAVLTKVGLIATIGGIVLSFGIALLADRYLPKVFFTFRNYTYQIFLMGIFVQMTVKIAYRHVTADNVGIDVPYLFAYIFCILVGLYVPMLLAKLVEAINWRPLSICYGLKQQS